MLPLVRLLKQQGVVRLTLSRRVIKAQLNLWLRLAMLQRVLQL